MLHLPHASLNAELLSRFRERRAAGASLKIMATELGITWQRLDKALRHGLPGSSGAAAPQPSTPLPVEPPLKLEPERAVLAKPLSSAPGLLVEKYRPQKLSGLFGQPSVVRQLRAFAQAPYPVALLFGGETGTGKTSAALALAAELGCAVEQQEFGGVHVLASGEQSAEAVRECSARMWLQPLAGSGWKVFILNEADRMHVQAETIWLDRIENLPPKTVVIFTTNFLEKLSPRFRDRCVSLHFESDARRVQPSARVLLSRIWQAESGKPPPPKALDDVLNQATQAGRLSFRRAVQLLQPLLPPRKISKRSSNRKGNSK